MTDAIKKINVGARLRVAGFYRLYLNGKPAGVARDHPNIITDTGLERLFNGSITFAYVGTGNAAPAVTDTALQASLGSTSTNSPTGTTTTYGGTTPNEYIQVVIGKRFPGGSIVGNVAEVGYGWNAGLLSRALVLDGGGSPTTISVTAYDTLDIEYIFRIYPTPVDATGTVTIGGIDYDYTIRPVGVTSTNWNPNSILQLPVVFSALAIAEDRPLDPRSFTGWITSVTYQNDGGTIPAYSGGSHQRQINFTWGLTKGNYAGGVESVFVLIRTNANVATFQCAFDTPIPKTAADQLDLSFMFSWGRV